jgi:hypothetical protein
LQLSSVSLEQLAQHAAPPAVAAAPASARQQGPAALAPSQQGSRCAAERRQGEALQGAASSAAVTVQPASAAERQPFLAAGQPASAENDHLQGPLPPAPPSPADTTAASPAPPLAGGRRAFAALPPLQLPATEAADAPPLLTARRAAVSPAQQELLATARQWQLSARSARSAAPEPVDAAEEEGAGLIPAYRPHAPPAAAALLPGIASARRAPATARPARLACEATPPRLRRAPASANSTPVGKAGMQRRTYGQEPGFRDIKEAYNAGGWCGGGEGVERE